MTTFLSAIIADHLLTLSPVASLTDRHEVMYHLTAIDLPTNKSYTHVIAGEDEAIRAFCAVVSSDDPDLSKDCAKLYETPLRPYMA